jgi:hypothetical protein
MKEKNQKLGDLIVPKNALVARNALAAKRANAGAPKKGL